MGVASSEASVLKDGPAFHLAADWATSPTTLCRKALSAKEGRANEGKKRDHAMTGICISSCNQRSQSTHPRHVTSLPHTNFHTMPAGRTHSEFEISQLEAKSVGEYLSYMLVTADTDIDLRRNLGLLWRGCPSHYVHLLGEQP